MRSTYRKALNVNDREKSDSREAKITYRKRGYDWGITTAHVLKSHGI